MIALDPLEDQVDDLFEELVDIQGSAYSQTGSVHDFPRGFVDREGVSDLGVEEFGFADWIAQIGPTDDLGVFQVMIRDDRNASLEVVFVRCAWNCLSESKNKGLFSDLHTIPIEERFGFDGLAVDGSAVAALEVSEDVGVTDAFDFGVFA
jgi:hypothetical protein